MQRYNNFSTYASKNRKIAQKLAHALEHDYSPEGIEWRLRFFHHYFHVVKGGAKPEPGLKPYSRFYQYVYVSIYRELKSVAPNALSVPFVESISAPSESSQSSSTAPCISAEAPSLDTFLPTPEDVSFVPINPRPLRSRRTYPLNALTPSSPHPLSSFPSELDFDKCL